MGKKTYYDVTGAADHTGFSRVTIYRWINEGARASDGEWIYLSCRTVDGAIQINEADLDNHLDALGYETEPDESDEDESDQK